MRLATVIGALDNERDGWARIVSRFVPAAAERHFMPAPEDVTRLLESLAGGDRGAVNQLLPLVYDELHSLARRQLRSERSDHSLQATALVHEAYLRMVDQTSVRWQSRAHFVAIAATAMRRILVDYARARARHKRGGGARERVSLDEALVVAFERDAGLVDLDDALGRMAVRAPERARIVEMRFFGGLTVEEIAVVLGISASSVNREWRYSRAWLYRELGGGGEGRQGPGVSDAG